MHDDIFIETNCRKKHFTMFLISSCRLGELLAKTIRFVAN